MELGNYIRAKRSEKGVTQRGLAESLGVTYQCISAMERSTYLPSIHLLLKLCNALKCPYGEAVDLLTQDTAKRFNVALSG